MRRSFRALCMGAAGLLLAACNKDPRPAEHPESVATDGNGDPDSAELDPPMAVSIPVALHRGVAHSGNIDMVALGPQGTCALSRDVPGGVRLWTALDGTAEPQLVPITGPLAMAVAPAGKGFTVFAVESSGGARIFSVQVDGSAEETAALPPFEPVASTLVLPGGERVVALMKDGAIRMLDRSGQVLAQYDERRFHPHRLQLSSDGKHLVAAVRLDRVAGNFRAELQRLKIGGTAEAPSIERAGVPRIVTSTNDFDATSVVISADAAQAAVAARGVGDKWDVELFDLSQDVDPKVIKVKVPQHSVPRLGFVAPQRLLVSSNDGFMSWLVDIDDGSSRPRISMPQDFNHQGRVHTTAPGRQVVGYGSYLFVHDVDTRRHRFLGYGSTQGAGVGLSPSGEYVAWAYVQGPLIIEPVEGDGEAVTVQLGSNNIGATRVRFVDDEHVVVVDSAGEASLVHWRSGVVRARAGVMGNVRNVQLDPEQGLLLIDRHNNDAWMYEISIDKGFEGPYIVADESHRLGILRPAPPSDLVMWTIDGSNKLREYTLDELRSDLSREQMDDMGKELKRGQPAPLAIDRRGRHYGVRWNGSELELFVDLGKRLGTKAVPSSDVNHILPSPDGSRFLVAFNRAGAVSIAVHETETLEPLWSYATGVFNNDTSWSADGRYVGLAATTGAVLLDAATGEPVRKRCGLKFVALSAPPPNAFNTPNQRSLCEL